MKYKFNDFLIDGIKAKILAKKYSTPLYCYSLKKIKENIKNFQKNFKTIDPLICFAVKANPNKIILRQMGKLGLGADVVSIGELIRALKAGIKPNKIVFSGVGKTSHELIHAIKKNILLINAESKSEILEIERIAKTKKKKVNVGVRLNPNTDAKTLSQISTGKKENKFGIPEKDLIHIVKYIKNSKYLNLKCLSVHIGSQILDNAPYEKMLKVVKRIINKTKFKFEYIDLGGGMGIDYENKNKRLNLNKYSKNIEKILIENKSKIIFEPGRSIIGNSGFLISKVIYIKEGHKKDFIILDAAMNDLMRPALYNANHRIIPASKNNKKAKKTYEFVGPICESTDKFSTLKGFQKLKEKDLILICDVGAYGMSLSSNYNLRPKSTELLINNSKIQIITKKQSLKDFI
jgi:diaminopimelate decarboxylase